MQSFFRRKNKHAPPPAQGSVLGRLDASGNEIWAPAHQPTPSSSTLTSLYAPPQAPIDGQVYAQQQQQQQQPLYRSPSPSIASVHSHASRRPTQASRHPPSTTSSHPPRARGARPSLRRQNSNGSIRDFVQDVGSRAREGLAHVARRASIDRRRPDAPEVLGESPYASSSTSINHLAAPNLGLGYGRAAKSATDLRLGRSASPGAAPPMPYPSHPAASGGTTRSSSISSHLQQPAAPTSTAHHPPPARRTFQQTARTSMESLRQLGRKASFSSRNRDPVPAAHDNNGSLQQTSQLSNYASLHRSTSMHSPSLRNEPGEDPWGDPFAADPPVPSTASSSVRAQPVQSQAIPDQVGLPQPHSQQSQPTTTSASYTYPYTPSQAPSQPSIRNLWSRPSTATSRPSTATSNHSSSVQYQGPTKSHAAPAAPTSRVPVPNDLDSTRSASINSASASGRLMPLATQRSNSSSNGYVAPSMASKGYPLSGPSQSGAPSGHAHQRSQGSASILSHSHSLSGGASLTSSHSANASIQTQSGPTQPIRKVPVPQQQSATRAPERDLPPAPGHTYARPSGLASAAQKPTNPHDGYAYPAAPAPAQAPVAKALSSTPPKRSPIGLGILGISMEGTVQPTPPRGDFKSLVSDQSNCPAPITRNLQPQPEPPPQAPSQPPPKSPPPEPDVHPTEPEVEVPPEPEQYHTMEAAPRLSLGQLDFGSDLGASLGLDDWTSNWDQSVKNTTQDACQPGTTPSELPQPSGLTQLATTHADTNGIRSASAQRSPKATSCRTEHSMDPDEEASNALEGLMNALTNDSLEPDTEEPLTPGTLRAARTQADKAATPVRSPFTHTVPEGLTTSANEVPAPSPTTIRTYSPPSSAARRSSSVRRLNRVSSRWSVGSGAKRKKVATGVNLEQYPLPSSAAPPILSPSTPATAPPTHDELPTVSPESELNHQGVDPCTLPVELKHLAPYLSPEPAGALFSNSSIIGEGECGNVYCADTIARTVRSPVKGQVAIKMVRRDTTSGQARLAHLAQELELWRQVSSEFVVRLYGAFVEPTAEVQSIWIVQGLMDRSVADVLAAVSDGPLDWNESHMARIVSDTATGLAHLHSSGIIHRDCRSDNLLMGADGTTKLSDFTHAASARTGPRHSVVGSPFWMAPEVILAKEYGTEIDLWSLGAVLWELVQGEPAYFDLNPREAVAQIARVGLPPLSHPEQWSSDLQRLLTHLTQLDPHARPTAHSVLSHPFCTRSADYGTLIRLLGQVHAVERGQGAV